VKGLAGTNAYLYLQAIEISKKNRQSRLWSSNRNSAVATSSASPASAGDNLFVLSNELDQYRDGFVVSDINANTDTLSFTNGVELTVGDATGDISEIALRRIQIRETIKAHFDKEMELFDKGVKVSRCSLSTK
jgi:type III restriction enzyme